MTTPAMSAADWLHEARPVEALAALTEQVRARPGDRFGDGEPKGVVAAESANNASEGGAMAILMSLGIPGSASTAVISGAFL